MARIRLYVGFWIIGHAHQLAQGLDRSIVGSISHR